MKPTHVLISSLFPFFVGQFYVYILLFSTGDGVKDPLQLAIFILLFIFPAYCLVCLPFYTVIYYFFGQLKCSIFSLLIILSIYLQGFIASLLLHVSLFDAQMLRVIFPLFTIMMFAFIGCIILFTKRAQRNHRIN